MGLRVKKKEELDNLLEDLGVLELPDNVELTDFDLEGPSQSEDPYSHFIPKSENEEKER
ncbi:MAG: hypothetical protein ACK5LM_02675 [Lactovum sp.]